MNFTLLRALGFFCFVVLLEIIPILGHHVRSTRIFRGDSVRIEDYPFQASIRSGDGEGQQKHFCGGSILDEHHIVTAAHCVYDMQSPESLTNIQVFTGTDRSDIGGDAHNVRSIKVHPEYNELNRSYFNDIAVVVLNEPIEFNPKQKPISLPTEDIVNGTEATVTGWGFTDYGGLTPVYLQKATMNLLLIHECQDHLPYSLSLQVCASAGAGVSACQGDSGGPLVANDKLVGVVSYSYLACGMGTPDVYTNVFHFLSFIKETLESQK